MDSYNGKQAHLILLLPVVLSFWLLGAHYLRGGNILLFLVLLFFPLMLRVRRAVIARIMQFCLVLVAIHWMLISYQMVEGRLLLGDDWLRMALIMGSVITLTLLSACSFLHPKLEHYYFLD